MNYFRNYLFKKKLHPPSPPLEIEWWPPYRETRIIFYAKWSKLQNTQQNSTKFSAMLGEDEKKLTEINFVEKIYTATEQIEKGYSQDLVKQTVDISKNYDDFNP